MDLSDIGISTTPNSFAAEATDDSILGIHQGDVVLMEHREPQRGEIFAVQTDNHLVFTRHDAESTSESAVKHIGVAIGLIRKF